MEVNFNTVYLERGIWRCQPWGYHIFHLYLSQPKALVLKHFGGLPEHVSTSTERRKKQRKKEQRARERKEGKLCNERWKWPTWWSLGFFISVCILAGLITKRKKLSLSSKLSQITLSAWWCYLDSLLKNNAKIIEIRGW